VRVGVVVEVAKGCDAVKMPSSPGNIGSSTSDSHTLVHVSCDDELHDFYNEACCALYLLREN